MPNFKFHFTAMRQARSLMADFVLTVPLTASVKEERILFRLHAMPKNSALCGLAGSCDSALCGIAQSCDYALCRIALSRQENVLLEFQNRVRKSR
jgi:hypothetical protein